MIVLRRVDGTERRADIPALSRTVAEPCWRPGADSASDDELRYWCPDPLARVRVEAAKMGTRLYRFTGEKTADGLRVYVESPEESDIGPSRNQEDWA